MPKVKTSFICQQCGAVSPAYFGRCPTCGSWNSMVETVEERRLQGTRRSTRASERALHLNEIGMTEADRKVVPIDELNRVLGGGLVPGSLVLIGGDPGIGKATLVLQAAAAIAMSAGPVLYVSAEESAQQIKLRADRLGLSSND